MNADIKAKWLEALRSGNYRQGYNELRCRNRHCALGVLCDIIDPDGWKEPDYALHRGMFSTKGHVPMEADLKPRDLREISTRNDAGKTFAEIADYIEANL